MLSNQPTFFKWFILADADDVRIFKALETSDMHDIIRRLGSSKVQQPITVVGIEHNSDRSIWSSRSEDAISTGRLSAMIPDDDGTTVEGASYLFLEREIS